MIVMAEGGADEALRDTYLNMLFFMMMLAWIILMIYTTSIVGVVVKVKKDLFITFAVYISLFFIRFVFLAILDTMLYMIESQDAKNPNLVIIMSVCSSLLTRIKWFIFYYFVLTTKTVVLMLQAESPQMYRKTSKEWKLKQLIIYSLFFFSQLGIFIVRAINSAISN